MSSVSYDDGLYHPPTTSSALTPSSTAALASTTIIPTPEATLIPVFPILSPLALAAPTTASLKSSIQIQSSILSIALASFVPSSSPVPTPESSPLAAIQIDTPPTVHSSRRAVATTLVVLFVVFGIVFVAGYLTSKRFRRWKDLRWTREPEPGWSSQDFDDDPSSKAMIQVKSGDTEKATKYDVVGNEYGQADPFARSMPRRSILQSYLDYRRGYNTDPVERIGEERGWLWGTRGSKKRSNSITTPGLGSGRYRAKSFKDGSRTSRSSRLLRSLNIPSAYQAPGAGHPQYLASEATLDEKLEERLDEDYSEELVQSRAEPTFEQYTQNQPGRQRGIYGSFPSIGASYLLTRLKDSISGRSKLSSLRSSDTRFQHDPVRGQWNEVGQWELGDEMETTADEYDSKTMRSQTPRRTPRKRELSLAEIPLPEVPVLAWDANAASHEISDPMAEPVRRSTRSWTLSSQVAPPLSFTCAPLKTSKDKSKAPVTPQGSASASAHTAGPGVFHDQQQRLLNPTIQHDSKQPYSIAGAAQAMFRPSNDLPTPRSRQKSPTMSRMPSKPLDSGSYTKLPTVRTHPRRPLPPHPSKGIVAPDGSIIHPGGFVGRSPTKKLRKKPSPTN